MHGSAGVCPPISIYTPKDETKVPSASVVNERSPDAVDVGLVGVGDEVQGGVRRGQGEHAAVQGLLGEGVVGGVMLARHHIHRHGRLQREGTPFR